jgi:IS605 OrfB family transposase
MVFGAYERQRFDRMKGQIDLVHHDGQFHLFAGIEIPDGSPIDPQEFLGVDLGIANLASESGGRRHTGTLVEKVRRRHNLQRRRLQRRGTKGAHKKMRRMRHKEARFRRHENHVISKQIVETAQRTGRGIGLEKLKGIRERVTARGGDARNRLGGWAFAQLGGFVVYKAHLAGVPVEFVDPAYTSQTCAECGHCARSNRTSQPEFHCQVCGHQAHADVNAARNIRAQAEEQWRKRRCGKPASELGAQRQVG